MMQEAAEIDPRLYDATAKKVREAFELVDTDRKGTVDKKKIGMIMRYLKSYPSEEDMALLVYPAILGEDSAVIKYEDFEGFMVNALVNRRWEPDTEETILQAFRVLDVEGKDYIDELTMVDLLTSNDPMSAFSQKEIEEFTKHARDEATGSIFYEDYVLYNFS